MSNIYTTSSVANRDPYGSAILSDPGTVFVRKADNKRCVWVPKTRAGEYRMMGYKNVLPKEVEMLEFNQFEPREKPFGAFQVDTVDNYFGYDSEGGRLYLMWCYQTEYVARQARAAEALGHKPAREKALEEGLEVEAHDFKPRDPQEDN